jgi:hypothetical protein
LKLLQQKFKWHEDAVRTQNKGPLKLFKIVLSISAPLLVLEKKNFKGNAFLAHFGTL